MPSKKENKIRFNFWMVDEQHEELERIAERQGRDISDILRQLIDEYLHGRRVSNRDLSAILSELKEVSNE